MYKSLNVKNARAHTEWVGIPILQNNYVRTVNTAQAHTEFFVVVQYSTCPGTLYIILFQDSANVYHSRVGSFFNFGTFCAF